MNEETENISIQLYHNFEDQLYIFKKLKKDFNLEISNSVKKITYIDRKGKNKKVVFSEFNEMNFKLYSLMSKVKKDARMYDEDITTNKSFNRSKYVHIDTTSLSKYGTCYKCDIKGAYWNTAKYFLNEETFLQGENDKQNRLISLGALAKKTDIHIYEKGILIDIVKKRSPYAYLFFQVSEIIDNLFKFAIDNGCFAYYVDCFFCTDYELSKDLVKYYEMLGYKLTFEQCEYRIFHNQIIIDNKQYFYTI